MLKTNYVSRQDYDTARTQLNEAEANVTVAKAAVEQATINLQYANVTSPITGVSGKSSVTVGALVTANQADSLVTVQRLDPIYVDLTQSVQDFLRMKEEVASGQIKQVQGSTPVQLNLENGKRYSQTGTLKFSDPTVDETTGSVTLRAIFPNPNGDLLPGMYGTALVDEVAARMYYWCRRKASPTTPRVKQRRSFWIKTMSCSYAKLKPAKPSATSGSSPLACRLAIG